MLLPLLVLTKFVFPSNCFLSYTENWSLNLFQGKNDIDIAQLHETEKN